MTSTALPSTPAARTATFDRARALARLKGADASFRVMTLAAALIVLVLLLGVAISLFIGAWPAFQHFGLDFFISDAWNPPREKFGAAAAIYGTLLTAIIAMLIGVPVGLGVAVFLTELCPPALRRPVGVAIELLAGIPSIIYGIWGVYYFKPFMQEYLQPALIHTLGAVPGIGALFAGPPLGIGVLTAGFILAVMVLPFISSIMRDVFETVPPVLKEAAYGVGATTFEVVGNIVLPYTRVGVIGGVMLALGRALGETMAVTFVIGNAPHIETSILAQGTTISAMIANTFADADPGLFTSSLLALGFILFLITFLVLAAARLMLARLENRGAR
ncbi:MAG: phosphate ABC transporter permease subunit PstC [Pseudomonadota bacterium]|nr:phosphate ABC transporter permease subunit PstC [Pseudomonadota bacterium]